jgi:hypothetical protein
VPSLPNITAVNALGDFWIAADRLAIIDGEGLQFWFAYTEHILNFALIHSGPVEA